LSAIVNPVDISNRTQLVRDSIKPPDTYHPSPVSSKNTVLLVIIRLGTIGHIGQRSGPDHLVSNSTVFIIESRFVDCRGPTFGIFDTAHIKLRNPALGINTTVNHTWYLAPKVGNCVAHIYTHRILVELVGRSCSDNRVKGVLHGIVAINDYTGNSFDQNDF
jgi:hypothetical protein